MKRIRLLVMLGICLGGCVIDQNDQVSLCDPADYEIGSHTLCDTTDFYNSGNFCDYVIHESSFLLPETKKQTKYMCPGMHAVIFENEHGRELIFQKTSVAEQNATQWSEPCNGTGDSSTLHCASEEEIITILRNDSLDLEFRIILNVDTRNKPEPAEDRDQLLVTIPKTADFGKYYSLALSYYITKGGAYESFNPRYRYEKEFLLKHKSYRDVIYCMPQRDSDRMEIYFSKGFGIVGFRDKTSTLWIFKKYG